MIVKWVPEGMNTIIVLLYLIVDNHKTIPEPVG